MHSQTNNWATVCKKKSLMISLPNQDVYNKVFVQSSSVVAHLYSNSRYMTVNAGVFDVACNCIISLQDCVLHFDGKTRERYMNVDIEFSSM